MVGYLFVINAYNDRAAVSGHIREEQFDRIVDVAAFGEHLQLAVAGPPEKFQVFGSGWQWHIAVAFVPQELFHHFISVGQFCAAKHGTVFPPVAGAAQIIRTGRRKLLAHRHVRLGRSLFRHNNFVRYFIKTEIIVPVFWFSVKIGLTHF